MAELACFPVVRRSMCGRVFRPGRDDLVKRSICQPCICAFLYDVRTTSGKVAAGVAACGSVRVIMQKELPAIEPKADSSIAIGTAMSLLAVLLRLR